MDIIERKKFELKTDKAKITIELIDENLYINTVGNIYVHTEGELGFATKGKKICIDTIDSQFHMNCRTSKALKDMPESIEFKKKIEEKKKQREEKLKLSYEKQKNQNHKCKYILELEEKIKKLEEKINGT